MKKHAYLIMCHNNYQILHKLVQLLDDPRNDIFIHIDKKASNDSDLRESLHTQYATLHFTRRINVNWAGYSQIHAELILLEAATQSDHAYYHLLSGVDLPIKTQDEIHSFFRDNYGKEYMQSEDSGISSELFSYRLQHYHFLQDYIGKQHTLFHRMLRVLEAKSLQLQAKLPVNRLNKIHFPLYKGANWFSITHNMALYILSRKKDIRFYFKHTVGADEIFLQTLAMQSPYAPNIVNDTLRCIDWHRGSPYTFRCEDFDLLMNSGKLFARKFDSQIDMDIVNDIYNALTDHV